MRGGFRTSVARCPTRLGRRVVALASISSARTPVPMPEDRPPLEACLVSYPRGRVQGESARSTPDVEPYDDNERTRKEGGP